jgi:WD40 repeat protein
MTFRKWLTLVGVLGLGAVLGFVSGAGRSEAQEAKAETPLISGALPEGALRRLGTARFRHGSRILCLAYSPNGRILAGGGGDDPVRLWDADTGQEIRQCKESWINAMTFSPGGSVLITGGAFKIIRLWEVATGKSFNQLKGHNSAVKSLALAPSADGLILASGDQEGSVILWELVFAKEITRFKGHTGEINALAFSPNHKVLASAGGDRSVRLWDVVNAKHLLTLDGRCEVHALTFLDDKTLASAGDDNKIHLWDAHTGRPIKILNGHESTVVSLLLAADKKTLISGALDRTIRFWDIAAGTQSKRIDRNQGDSEALTLSRDGKYLATAGYNSAIRRWNTASGAEIHAEPGHLSPITAAAVSPNGKFLVAGSSLAQIRLWDLAGGKELRRWKGPTSGDLVLAYSPDGKTVASAAGFDAVHLWDPYSGNELRKLAGPPDEEVLSVAFSPDSKTLAVGYRNQAVRLWNANEATVITQLKYAGPVYALAFSQDGKSLAASGAGKIALYDVGMAQEIRQFGPEESSAPPSVGCMAFAPDGKTLATGSFDGMIRLWDAVTGQKLREMEGHTAAVYSLAFSADGRNLASGSFDKSVRLWEAFSGKTIKAWHGHAGPVGAVSITPNGRVVISGSNDTTLLLWDVTARSQDGKVADLTLSADQLKSGWKDLASEEAPPANLVLWNFVAAGKESVPFLGKQVFLVDPARIQQLLKDLNNNKYPVRENASSELGKYGRWIEGVLREALKRPESEEVRRRIERLLSQLQVPGSLSLDQERLRLRRTMLILEQVGGPESRKTLENLVRGAPEEAFRQEAQASLERMNRRGS